MRPSLLRRTPKEPDDFPWARYPEQDSDTELGGYLTLEQRKCTE